MSAATGFARQEDDFDKLLKLATLNATDIKAAGEENRRQMQLTQDELEKVAAARTYITKHTALAADLKSRESALAIAHTTHVTDKEEFAAHVKAENIRLETVSANIDARDRVTAENLKKSEQALKIADALKASYDSQHREAMAGVKVAENVNIEIGKRLVTEEARLKEWEATLKAKAERIRQQAANF